MASSLFTDVESARERLRQDVADQLRIAGEKAGVAATVLLDPERVTLQFDETINPAPARIVATFDDDHDPKPDEPFRISLWAETPAT
jgi:hypothetical protein